MQQHVVVDGSNIATEGRPLPSLKQLNEAVLAYIEEHPDTLVTVVVDATFGHRIATKEIAEFDDAIANNELVSPPAGAIGRGDAFVLSIAKKAHATILSNDSFQEFHGEHPWLFDEGRLVGGKPVPHVGWVFVARNPVRGPISRRAVKDTKAPRSSGSGADAGTTGRPSALASAPMPVPTAPPPGRRGAEPRAAVDAGNITDTAKPAESGKTGRTGRGRRSGGAAPAAEPTTAGASVAAQAPIPAKGTFINELMPFLSFVEAHPVGSQVEITIDAYASHGAYATSGDARCYLPLRFMAEPAPRAARDVVKLGDTHVVVVVSFNPARRGIDVALPTAVPAGISVLPLAAADAPSTAPATGRKPRAGRKAASAPDAPVTAVADAPAPVDVVEPVVVEARPSRRRGSKAVAAPAEPTRPAEPTMVPTASEPSAPRGRRPSRTGDAASSSAAPASRSRRPAAASDDESATGRGRAGRRGKAAAAAADAAVAPPTQEVFVPAPAAEAPVLAPMSPPDAPAARSRRTRPAASTPVPSAASGRAKATPAPVSEAPTTSPTKRTKAAAPARAMATMPASAAPVVAASSPERKPAKKARATKSPTPVAAMEASAPPATASAPSARRRSPAKKAAGSQPDASGVKPLRAKKA